MYALIKGYVKRDKMWSPTDLSSVIMKNILYTSDDVKLHVTMPPDEQVFSVKLSDNKHLLKVGDGDLTFTQWLGNFTSASLVNTPANRGLVDSNSADYFDMFRAGFTGEPGRAGYGEGVKVPYNTDVDMVFSTKTPPHERFSALNVGHNSIVAVNGRFMETFYDNGRVYVTEAAKRVRQEKLSTFAALDFTDVGGCVKESITSEKIKTLLRTATDIELERTRVKVDLETDLSDKTLLLVMDGILYLLDDEVYKTLTPNQIVINVYHNDVMRYASRWALGKLGYVLPQNIRGGGINKDTLSVKDFLSETDTFIVAIKNTDLALRRERLGRLSTPCRYSHYRRFKGFTRFDNGEAMHYSIDGFNQNKLSLVTPDNRKVQKMYETVKWDGRKVVFGTDEIPRTPKLMGAEVIDIFSF